MTLRLEGKIALVTGGSSGIGRAAALAFAAEGARVVVADVNPEGGAETIEMIGSAGGEAMFILTDVSQASQVEAMVSQTIEAYGRLDYAYNNAGVGHPRRFTADCDEDDWDRVININLKGVWLCMKYEIPPMLRQGKGAIVNAASTLGLVGRDNRSAYTASKHDVVGLTKVAALEYANAGIRVNAVCPGFILTPVVERAWLHNPKAEAQPNAAQPMGRPGTPEDVAKAVVWLCSDAASFVTGQAMVVDGGRIAG